MSSKKSKSKSRKPRAVKAAEVTKATTERKPGIKAQVAALLSAGGSYTVEELLKETGAKTEVTVKTALSDLKSKVYCGLSSPLAIVSEEGRYRLLTETDMRRLGQAIVAKEEGKQCRPLTPKCA